MIDRLLEYFMSLSPAQQTLWAVALGAVFALIALVGFEVYDAIHTPPYKPPRRPMGDWK